MNHNLLYLNKNKKFITNEFFQNITTVLNTPCKIDNLENQEESKEYILIGTVLYLLEDNKYAIRVDDRNEINKIDIRDTENMLSFDGIFNNPSNIKLMNNDKVYVKCVFNKKMCLYKFNTIVSKI